MLDRVMHTSTREAEMGESNFKVSLGCRAEHCWQEREWEGRRKEKDRVPKPFFSLAWNSPS